MKRIIYTAIGIIVALMISSIFAWVQMTKQINIGYSSWLELQTKNFCGREFIGNENNINCKLSEVILVGTRVIMVVNFFDNNKLTNNEAVFELNTWNVNGVNGSKF